MPVADLNLLHALDALLEEGSVTRAALRLGLSPSAMSRALARLRAATGDPLLVQAGRGLVATPHAQGLRDRVHALAREANAVLAPSPTDFDPGRLERTFVIRANEGFLALFAAALVAAVTRVAPGVGLRFSPKADKDASPLREGRIDLDVGVAGETAPEVRSRVVLRDRFVGAARVGHPLLSEAVTAERYAACLHVVSSRRGASEGPVDAALRALGLARRVVVIAPGFPDAINIARRSDLVALVPRACFDGLDGMTDGLTAFELPVRTPPLEIAVMWHPRLDGDPAHRWLRDTVITACLRARPGQGDRAAPTSGGCSRHVTSN
jgi:DNA-binding transcriptional LysR family regulator